MVLTRSALSIVVTWLLLAGCSKQIAAQPSAADLFITASYATATTAMEMGDTESALLSIQDALEPSTFDPLSPARKYDVLRIEGHASLHEGQWVRAHRALLKVTAYPQADNADWQARLLSAIMSNAEEDILPSFKHLADSKAPFLKHYPWLHMQRMDQLVGLLPNYTEARILIGQEAERQDWRPIYAEDDPSPFWLNYVEALVSRGDVARASKVAARISDPEVIGWMHKDRRFDAVLAMNPQQQDLERAKAAYLEAAETQAAEKPRLLGAKIAVSEALVRADRLEVALQVLDEASETIANAPRGHAPFDDMYEVGELPSYKAAILGSLGRSDEAIGLRLAQAGRGAGYTLTLGAELLGFDRNKDALKWLNRVQSAEIGPHGQMRVAQYKVCAADRLGEQDIVKQQMALLVTQERRMPKALMFAYLCLNDMEAAAEVAARQLEDPRYRLAALTALSDEAGASVKSPYNLRMTTKLAALRDHPRVRAQIQKVGRL